MLVRTQRSPGLLRIRLLHSIVLEPSLLKTMNLYHHEVEPLRIHLLRRYSRRLIVKGVATHNEYIRFNLRRPSDTTIPSDKCDLCVQGVSGRKQVQKLWLDSHTTPTKISSSARGAFYLGTMAPQGTKSEFDGHIHSLRRIFRYFRRCWRHCGSIRLPKG